MEEKKKDGRGGKRVGAGRKSQRETAGLIQKLKPYEDHAIEQLMSLVDKGDVQAIKLYFAYLAGNPTTTTNSNIQAEVTSIDLREIITFSDSDEDLDDDDLFS